MMDGQISVEDIMRLLEKEEDQDISRRLMAAESFGVDEPEMTGTQTRQAKLDHIAARGNFARKTPFEQRSPEEKEDIADFLAALGTPTKAWEEEESRSNITLPPEQNEDITQPQTINELSGTVPPDISNMSDSSIRNTSTHEMKNPDGTVTLMPGPSHEEYLNQEGLESVGADIPSEYELSRSKIPMTAKELKDRKDMMEAFGYPSRSRY
jgi:hypothetical protein